ncbi:hypothetical protein K9M16_00875 [Candidatus Babeliales bacterium]|nr:hypothetical protein [Candidatus Babeliales bacterium]
MNKFKKMIFSLFLFSVSFTTAFLMEDAESTEIEQIQNIALEREYAQMSEEDAVAWELKIDKIAFTALCAPIYSYCSQRCFNPGVLNSEEIFNFYRNFKYKIDPAIKKLNLDYFDNGFNITDKVLFFITQKFKNLEDLALFRAFYQTTYNGIINLINSYPNLKNLRISFRDKITDQYLYAFANSCHKLQSLVILDVSEVSNDAILAIIRNCPDLQTLELHVTTRKQADANRFHILKRALPNFHVMSEEYKIIIMRKRS